MKTIKLKALATAIAVFSTPTAFAEIDLYQSESGSALSDDEQAEQPTTGLGDSQSARVFLHTQIEVEKEIRREDPSEDGGTEDEFDNEIEFGVGVEFDSNWSAYFELEYDALADNSSSRFGDGRDGDIEARNAFINWENDTLGARVGVFRPDFGNDSRLWYREHLSGVRLQSDFGSGIEAEVGSGILSEEGNAFGDDRQITWLKASLGGFYAYQGLLQDGAQGDEVIGEDTGIDPAEGPFGDLYNFAVGWSGDIGPVETTVEFNQNFGEAETGEDYKGQAAFAEFATEIGGLEPYLLFAWGSGDDDPDDNDVDEFQEARGDFLGTKIMLDEQFIENIATSGVGGVGENGKGIGNITLAQVGTRFEVNPVWETSLSVSGLSLSEDNDEGDSYLGTELNMFNQWDLPTSRKVRLYLDLAYVFADDAFGPDDVWLIEPGVRVTF